MIVIPTTTVTRTTLTPDAFCGCNHTWGLDGVDVVRPCGRHQQARCTCPVVWHAIVPPPRCPVHGQAQMPLVSC